MADILCIGNAAADVIARTVHGYPPRGGLRTFESLNLSPGGCAVNCAMALARMGVGTDLIVKLGDDLFGRFLLDEARRVGVGCDAVRIEPGATSPFTFVVVHPDGERSFLHCPGTNATIAPQDLDRSLLRRAKFCVMTGAMTLPCLQGPTAAALLADARRAGAVTVLETVYVDRADNWPEVLDPCLPHADYFAPSLPEAAALTGRREPEAIARLLVDRGAHNVVIKLAEGGAFARDASGHSETVAALPVDEVVDATGGGNCFVAGLVAGLQMGWHLPQAARLGNAIAAQCIVAAGATTGVRPLSETLRMLDDAG
ncbi:MAG: carbohydrate kinase family protein [Planctomycetota bacterium]|jgi:sugar/nucleoside kinase (ribokinase family)